jgi:arylsulfatase A-like enzyme
MAAIKPALPGLLARIALVCALGGAVLGTAAALLARAWNPQRFWAAFAAELAALWFLLAWVHAIWRPALFDDVAWLRRPLEWLVAHGQPWHVAAAAIALLAAHAWRLRPVRRVAGAAAVAMMLSVTADAPAAQHPRLFLLIGIDALRPDRLGKGEITPNLDAFARDATVFTRAYTPIAQTEPAWRSLLTARWPHVAGSRYPLTAEALWPRLPVFPVAFAQAGYATHFETDCSRFNFQSDVSGFAERHQPPRGALNFALEKFRFRTVGLVADNALGAYLVPELIDNRAVAGIHDPLGYAHRLAGRIVDSARHGPTLFAFHSTAAHFPGDPTYPFYRKFVSSEAPLERRLRMHFTPIANGTPAPEGWGREDSEALYDELIAQGDAQIGVVFKKLKDAGLYDDAFIVVFSDHGESFHPDVPALGGSTPVHGARLQEDENHMVLMVKPPHGKGGHVDNLVRLLDIGPTLLDAAGLPALSQADGATLMPRVRGEEAPAELLYAETGYTHASPAAFDPNHLSRAPRTFDAYKVRPDGIVEMSPDAHSGALAEKDVGAFDGVHWLVRAPQADGTVVERCDGNCEQLGAFLEDVQKEKP